NHNQFNTVWPSETPPATTLPRTGQEQIAKVHLGALAQAFLLDRLEYLDVLRDHAAAVTWVPAGTNFVSQYQDADRIFVQHNQEGVAAPQISLPVQGTVAADALVAARQLKDLVNAGSPQNDDYASPRMECPGRQISPDGGPGDVFRGKIHN